MNIPLTKEEGSSFNAYLGAKWILHLLPRPRPLIFEMPPPWAFTKLHMLRTGRTKFLVHVASAPFSK
jgi:hypothetical protein